MFCIWISFLELFVDWIRLDLSYLNQNGKGLVLSVVIDVTVVYLECYLGGRFKVFLYYSVVIFFCHVGLPMIEVG